ncbi:hypothetical protein [Desulfoscipio geothermicus]|uniref:Uncharacterized protein n=1 Tax=Desulfoscipio geothermicus DSM 3669 TaxID=1121426 RepID=A0A1I6DTJ9_9FIRM|nr:hypothetical protein [Desulfoscipio geothermicus]SFR08793.1 hypothetical protein SAMN05660706_11757 [Desulfoscipio geothermicus DSM 3669]
MKVDKYPHYLFGHLSWSPRPDVASNTAEFKLIMAFRRDFFNGSGADGYPVRGDKILDTVGGSSLAFGDGVFTGMLRFLVVDDNEQENWILCRALDPSTQNPTILHTYSEAVDPYTGEPWQAGVQSCYRIGGPEHVNNPEGSYRLVTLVDFLTLNSSPVAIAPVTVNAPCNAIFSFPIAAVDPDGDDLTCRLATGVEASGFAGGFVQPGPPHAPNPLTVDAETFVVTWDTAGTEPGQLWSYQIVVEDGKTRVGVDALIRIIEHSGEPPRFYGPDGTLTAKVAVPFSVDIAADDEDDEIVDVKCVNLPQWASLEIITPLPSREAAARITGTPEFVDRGMHAALVIFTDNHGNQAISSLIIDVDAGAIMQFHPCQGA